MTERQRLANRRPSEFFEFESMGLRFTASLSRFPDGRLAELFLDNHKAGSAVGTLVRDAAIAVSFALQFGADPEAIRAALCRDSQGNASGPLAKALRSACRGRVAMTSTIIGSSAEVIDFATVKATTRPAPGKFEKFRERWLRQLALDHELPAGALRLCMIVSTYLSRHSGHSWPGMTRLARETGLSRRWIQDLTQLVEKRGHWTVIRTKVGPKNFVNHYIPTLRTAVPQSREAATSLGGEVASSLGGREVATSPEPLKVEPLSEPLKEPLPNGRDYIAAEGNTQLKGLADEGRGATLASSDNPLSSSQRSHRGKGTEPSGLFSESWFFVGDALNHDGGRRR